MHIRPRPLLNKLDDVIELQLIGALCLDEIWHDPKSAIVSRLQQGAGFNSVHRPRLRMSTTYHRQTVAL